MLGRKICTMDDMKNGINDLHKLGPKIVAISSTDIDDKLTSVVSNVKGKQNWLCSIHIDFSSE